MNRLLLVTSQDQLADRLVPWFSKEGALVQVAPSADEAMQLLNRQDSDLILLDRQLADCASLLAWCKHHCPNSQKTPIFLLTANYSIDELEWGLSAGADEYATVPIRLSELSSRVRALIRRSSALYGTVLTAGALVLDTKTKSLLKNGKIVHLQPLEFSLLEFFMRHPDQIFSLDQLAEFVWRSETS